MSSGQCFFCPFVACDKKLVDHIFSSHKVRLQNHSCTNCSSGKIKDVQLTSIKYLECLYSIQLKESLSIPDVNNNSSEETRIYLHCPFMHCDYFCLKPNKLLKHVEGQHKINLKGIHMCFQCDFECNQINELICHFEKSHENRYFKCCDCSFICNDSEYYSIHVNFKHSKSYDNKFACKYCGKKEKDSLKFITHFINNHQHNLFAYICIKCNFSCKEENLLTQHIQNVHPLKFSSVSAKTEISEKSNKTKLCDQYIMQNYMIPDKHNSSEMCIDNRTKQFVTPRIDSKKENSSKQSYSIEKIKEKFLYTCPNLLCTYSSKKLIEINKHCNNVHNLSGIYNCSICWLEIQDIHQLNEHYINVHNCKLVFLCNSCDYLTYHQESFLFHKKFKHETVPGNFKCMFCENSKKSALKFFLHLKDSHNVMIYPFKCYICPFATQDEVLLMEHKLMEHNIKYKLMFIPPTNKMIFKEGPATKADVQVKTKKTENTEVKNKISDIKYSNNSAKQELHSVTLSNKENPKSKEQIKVKSEIYECSNLICSYKATDKVKCQKHMQSIHHLNGIINCSLCFFAFMDKEELFSHYKKSHKVKVLNHFKCSHCTFVTLDQQVFQDHLEFKHLPMKKFKCRQCSCFLKSAYKLALHLKNNHESSLWLFKCGYCEFSAQTESLLASHLQTNHGIKYKPFSPYF